MFVKVESVADDEFGRNLEAAIVDVDIYFCSRRLAQQCGETDFGRVLLFQFGNELLGGVSSVDDILDNHNCASGDVLIESEQLLYRTSRLRSAIRLEPDERDFRWEIDLTE